MTDIRNDNVINDIKKYDDKFFNIIFADPPYNLGSKIVIDPETNKPILKNAKDFMGKWKFDHEDWEVFFNESYRTLKSGGYCLLYGMDRQLPLIQYYGLQAGFEICQSLYWYFTSSFPKSFNVGKGINKKEGFTAPSHPTVIKYEGYKYGIAPLKQTCETIMVFRKPMKYKSILENIYAYEAGENIHLSIQDVGGNRVPYLSENDMIPQIRNNKREINGGKAFRGNSLNESKSKAVIGGSQEGRYPSQLFIEGGASEVLDEQSGVVGVGRVYNSGGCSRINHIIELTSEELYYLSAYDVKDFDLLNYNTKVNQFERNAGCENIKPASQTNTTSKTRTYNDRCGNCGKKFIGPPDKICSCDNPVTDKTVFKQQNFHPTVKALNLNYKIMKLFTTPNIDKQNWYVPFSGSGSEIISAEALGVGNIYACEGSTDFVEISKARVEFWKKHKWFFKENKKEYNKKKNEITKKVIDKNINSVVDLLEGE